MSGSCVCNVPYPQKPSMHTMYKRISDRKELWLCVCQWLIIHHNLAPLKDLKKVEHQRIDTFELWCWRRPLRVPCTARRSNQSTLKEISPEYSLERLTFIGKAETPILCVPDLKNWVIGKDPDAGKDWRWVEMGMTVDEMAGWHYRLNGR